VGDHRVANERVARWLSVCLLLAGLAAAGVAAAARAATAAVNRSAAVTYAPPSNAGEPLNERFRGVNWERSGDNFTTGDLLQDGLTASDSYDTVYMKATQILTSLKTNLNINTVRLGLNEATVADTWWTNYGAVVQAATKLHMNVVLAFWSPSNSTPGSVVPCTDGTFTGCYPVSDYAPWWAMWQKVIDTYASYGNVYLMPFNEAAGYSDTATGYEGPSATQLADLDAAWLAHYRFFPRGRVILGGTGDDYYLTLGHDHRLDGTLLSYHPYCSFGLNFPTEAAWTQWLKGQIAGMESRTVITEFGLGQGTMNFDGPRDGNNCVSYVYAVTDYARAQHLGLIYWDYGSTDTWSVATRTGDGTADSPYVTHIRNQSFADRLEWGYGLNMPLAPTISSAGNVTYTYDDTDPALQYSGNWTHAANQSYTSADYKDTESFSGQAGDSVTVPFSGTAIRWIGSQTSNHGLADVYLDGTKEATVDTSGGQDQAVLFSKSGLTNGPHTLKIVVDGTHSAGSTANYVSIDAIDVPTGSAASSTSTSFYTGGGSNSFSVETTGNPTARLTASGLGGGALPTGVSFTDNGDGTGTLSGNRGRLVPGTYPVTLTAQNSQGSSTQTLTLTVAAGPPPAPTTGVIAGTITDASGRPLARVCAHVFVASSLPGYTGNNYAPATYQACSASNGTYSIPLVTPGTARYNVQFIDQNAKYMPQWYGDTSGAGTAALKGYNHPGTPVTVTAGTTTKVNATMQPIPSGITVNQAEPGRSSGSTSSVSGTITVTNHNNVPLTGVNVTDSVNDRNAKCTVTGGTGARIPASPLYPGALATATFPYTCTYSAPPASVNEVDTANAAWAPNTNVPNDSYQYTQQFRTRP
jgi:Carboxypeptidase regulatory-like domain